MAETPLVHSRTFGLVIHYSKKMYVSLQCLAYLDLKDFHSTIKSPFNQRCQVAKEHPTPARIKPIVSKNLALCAKLA